MAVTLVGEVVNSADAITGFNAGNISADDDFVEGAGAIGAKISAAYQDFYTTSLGATAPYDFSGAGSEDGWHMVIWFGVKLPTNATSGLRMIMGDGTSRGEWYVPEKSTAEPKERIFFTRVVDTARDFDNIAAGSWTLTGNPGQLTSVSQMGGGVQTTVSIMGNFNSGQIDQFTIGLGARVDAGTVGTPNTFETVRAADEGSAKWGWWSSTAGSFIAKGKLYIGPETGAATSVFTDAAFSVLFFDELVAADFYEINIRGAGTDVDWSLSSISAADPAIARWRLTVDSTTNSFADTNGVWSGGGDHVLNANSTLTGTTIIDTTSMTQNGATLNGVTVLDPNTTSGVAFLTSDDPGLISNSEFNAGDAGHAIEITTAGTYQFDSNFFTGYGADGTNDAAIYNNSGGAVTLNIEGGGDLPTIRNGTGATTTVQATVVVRVTALDAVDSSAISGARVLLEAAAGGPLAVGTDILSAETNVSGVVEDVGFAFASDQPVTGRVRKGSASPLYKTSPISGTITAAGFQVNVFMVSDE